MIYSPGMSMSEVEKNVIIAAMRYFHGNKTQTAKSLGIAYNTLEARLKEYKDAEDELNRILDEKRKKSQLERRKGGFEPVVNDKPLQASDLSLAHDENPLVKPKQTQEKKLKIQGKEIA